MWIKKIILTGCAGFVGSNVTRELVRRNYDVLGVSNFSFGDKRNLSYEIKCFHGDFVDVPVNQLNEYDVLIHMATSNIQYAMNSPFETFLNNAANTIKLFNKFKGKIVYTSTASVYGQADNFPTREDAEIRCTNAYDISKHVAELFLEQRGNYTTLRLSNVIGRGQFPHYKYGGVVPRMIDAALNSEPIQIIGAGNQTRDYTYVDDVVSAIMLATEQDAKNCAVNISSSLET